MKKLNKLTISEASVLLARREISSVELTRSCFEEIEKKDGELHAFLSFNKENSLREAELIDDRRGKGESLGTLAGIPCAIKDNILIQDLPASAGSKILEPYRAAYDASVISKLREAGSVFLGKTNLDEFGMGSSTENSRFGPTKNPHDPSRVSGGSSGGSAAAVAAHECIFALGSDTGGSIRQPASFCGVVGLKPTYGAVSRSGLIALASSLDQIGPMTKSVEDCATALEAIAGRDPKDSTTSPRAQYRNLVSEIGNWKLEIGNLRIGVPKEYFGEGLDPEVEKKVKDAIEVFEKLGAQISEISLPHTPYALACYYIIMPAEASANLARYDGIRYAARIHADHQRGSARINPQKSALEELYYATRGEGFGPEPRRRIMLGTYVLSSGYYEAYYAKAQRVRKLIRDDFEKAFEEVDVILTPTSPTPAFPLGERREDPLAMYLADIYTVSINLAGLPAVSIPCGRAASLPVGLQIIGKPFDEATILKAAYLYENHANT
ncbi:MAG: Asp-tRNA(Asn)/Glu-tRNA(Gln) amidotransferase subunit GatA [Parcubacteria group bacterium]|nr:Asp-tRNA(Asn)/Glu-tRNA(Gln) amidotransferase subunit GatA [Parcubacteria group bacterium]